MLEKYLSEKGGISVDAIKNLFPDLAELIQTYTDLKHTDDPAIQDELGTIELEILEKLKDREEQIDEYLLKEVSVTTTSDESEAGIFDMQLEPIGEEPAAKTVGYKFTAIEFTKDAFLKLLSIFGIDFQPKVKSDSVDADKFFWLLNEATYIVTTGMPFNAKVDLYIFAPDDDLDNFYNAIQAKANNYETKEQLTEENMSSDLHATDLKNFVSPDFVEPMTGMQFKHVDEAVIDLFKIDSAAKLLTLLELSTRKMGCGCGQI